MKRSGVGSEAGQVGSLCRRTVRSADGTLTREGRDGGGGTKEKGGQKRRAAVTRRWMGKQKKSLCPCLFFFRRPLLSSSSFLPRRVEGRRVVGVVRVRGYAWVVSGSGDGKWACGRKEVGGAMKRWKTARRQKRWPLVVAVQKVSPSSGRCRDKRGQGRGHGRAWAVMCGGRAVVGRWWAVGGHGREVGSSGPWYCSTTTTRDGLTVRGPDHDGCLRHWSPGRSTEQPLWLLCFFHLLARAGAGLRSCVCGQGNEASVATD